MLFAVLNPYILKVPLLDENIIALTIVSILIYLCLVDAPGFLQGMICGILISVSDLGIFFIPPLFFAAYFLNKKKAPTYYFVLAFGLVIGALPRLMHQFFAFGNFLNFAAYSFAEYKEINEVIKVLFFRVKVHGLFNYPLYHEIVRSPFNPFPTFLMWPLSLLKHFGALLTAFSILGTVYLFKKEKNLAIFFLLWFLPPYCFISLLENWIDPKKMHVIITLITPLIIFIGYGMASLLKTKRKQTCLIIVILIVFFYTFLNIVSFLDFKSDPRVSKYHRFLNKESNIYLQGSKKSLTSFNLLPDFRLASAYSPVFHKDRIKELFFELIFPGYNRNDADQLLYSLNVKWVPKKCLFDFSKHPLLNDSFVSMLSGSDESLIVSVDTRNPVLLYGIEVPWSRDLLNLYIYSYHNDIVAHMFFVPRELGRMPFQEKIKFIFLHLGGREYPPQINFEAVDKVTVEGDFFFWRPTVAWERLEHVRLVNMEKRQPMFVLRIYPISHLKIIDPISPVHDNFRFWDLDMRSSRPELKLRINCHN